MNIRLKDRNILIKIPSELDQFSTNFESLISVVGSLYNLENISISMIFFKEKNKIQASTFTKDSKKFIIYFNSHNLTTMRFVELLLHEFKHIQQYTQKRLIRTSEGHLWEGTLFPECYTHNDINYENLPWEIESFKSESHWNSVLPLMNSKILSKVKSLVTFETVLS